MFQDSTMACGGSGGGGDISIKNAFLGVLRNWAAEKKAKVELRV